MTDIPWTFEPFEIEAEPTWTIYDPNLARVVAVFHNEGEARIYLKWRNKKQSKRKAAHQLSRCIDFDWDGTC